MSVKLTNYVYQWEENNFFHWIETMTYKLPYRIYKFFFIEDNHEEEVKATWFRSYKKDAYKGGT